MNLKQELDLQAYKRLLREAVQEAPVVSYEITCEHPLGTQADAWGRCSICKFPWRAIKDKEKS